VSPPNTDDVEAWTASLAGDGAAFAAIFERHQQRVLRHSLRLVPSPEDAKDVVALCVLPGSLPTGEVVIDPAGGRYVGDRFVLAGADGHLPAGTVLELTAVTTSVVDEAPA
jgi:hypothetical protein